MTNQHRPVGTRFPNRPSTAAIALLLMVAALPAVVVADPFPDPDAPVADFSYTATDELAPVDFLDATTDPLTGQPAPDTWTWAWDFGGLGESAEREPSFDFHDGGDFAVRLTVTDDDGRAGTVEHWVSILHLPPRASFTAAAIDDLTPVAFASTTTHPSPIDADPATWTYAWDFAGLASSAERNPSYLFPAAATYVVRLTVTDDDGQASSVQRSISVPSRPQAAFTARVVDETVAVEFRDTTTDPDAPAPAGWTYAWDFAGLDTSAERHPALRFAEGGAYAITLVVTDHLGRIGTTTRDVVVPHASPAPALRFTVLEGGQLEVEDLSTHPNPADADPAGWGFAWTFSDGATATGPQASHQFAEIEPVQVTLAVTDDDGIVGTLTKTIDLADLSPQTAFHVDGLATTPGPSPPFTARPNLFYDLSTDDRGIVAWHWTFGDGSTSAEQHPTHQYQQPGDYAVTLEATDTAGGFGAVTRTVHVCANPLDVRSGTGEEQREFNLRLYPDGSFTFHLLAEAGLYVEACLAVNP